jgi:hypothetical protein
LNDEVVTLDFYHQVAGCSAYNLFACLVTCRFT